MAIKRERLNTIYGYPNAQANQFPDPIVLDRDPTTADQGEIGQMWINQAAQTAFVLCDNSSNVNTWVTSPSGGGVFASVVVNPGDVDVTAGDVNLAAGDVNALAGAVNSLTLATGNSVITGTLDVTGNTTLNGDLAVTGNVAVTGDFDITDPNTLTINVNANAAGAFAVIANGGAAATIIEENVQGTDNAAVELKADVGGVTLTGGKAAATAINLTASNAAGGLTGTVGTGGYQLTSANGSSVFNVGVATLGLSSDAAASTINIGTGAASVKTISLGGTGANIIAIANTQTAGSLAVGTAMTTGTISIGGTGLQTGNFDLAPGTGGQTITLANGSGIKVISIGNGVNGNGITIGNGINTSAQFVDIANGASGAASDVAILSGVGTAGNATILLGNNRRVITADLANVAPVLNRTVTVGGGTVVTAAVTDTINVGTGGATTNANSIKTVNVGSGALTLGENHVNIGSGTITSGIHDVSIQTGNAAAGTVTMQLSTGTGTKSVAVGNADGNTTIGLKGIVNINASQNSNTAINTGTSTGTIGIGNSLAGAITVATSAGIDMDAATASHLTVTGVADLTLSSVGGSVVVSATEVAVDSIQLTTAATGGITINQSSAALISNRAITVTGIPASTTGLAVTTTVNGVGAIITSSAATIDALQLVGGGLSVSPVSSAAGASPRTVDARHGQAIFTDVIANGAYGTLVIANSMATVNSIILANASCTTVNSAVQIVEITPSSGPNIITLRIFNAGAAATAANILVNFWVCNT